MTKALTYVEIDVPFCANVYGEAPCTATLEGESPTGEIKCFNSLKTCQDRVNYVDDPVTMRFSTDSAHLPKSIEAIPSIVGLSITPATVSLGRDLGERGSVRVTFKDHRWPDTATGFDKYVAERPYDPFKQGTFWGKFRARQPFLRGRSLRLIRGALGQTLGSMETRHYVIDSFDHNARDGTYSIVAKDILKLADGDRAQAPRLSQGFLVSGIDDNDTAATLSPSGIGNEEYPEAGHVAIGGKEICAFTRTNDALTLTRGQLNTVAIAHEAQDRVQVVLRYEAEDAADILRDLFVNYAGIDDAFVPLAAWQAETEAFLSRVFSADIAEPTPVKQLASELIEDAALSLWWDDVAQSIRLRVLRAISTDAALFDDGNILAGSLSTREQPAERLSQIWRYFAKRNALEGQDDADNYRSIAATADLEAETDYGSPAIHRIYSRWIPFGGRSVADRANALHLSRFRDPPRRFSFGTFRDGTVAPVLGAGYRLAATGLQADTGAPTNAPIQITRLKPGDAGFEVEAEEMLAAFATEEDLLNRTIIVDGNSFNLNLRTLHDALFPAPEVGGEGEDIVNLTCIVEAGVIVGSTSTANPAFDIGEWPEGFPIKLIVNGRLQGMGGKGGGKNDGGSDSHLAKPGHPGGPALYTRFAIDLELASGEIWGGGGGGGSGMFNSNFGNNFYGGGGGGGAGTDPGGLGTGHGGTAQNGQPGTSEAGGDGGAGMQSRDGGDGGDPGEAGENGAGSGGGPQDPSGGNPGAAIDGVSFVTVLDEGGDIRGPEVN